MTSILRVFDPTSKTWKGVPAIKGKKGERGEKGDRGVQGIQGIQGIQGFSSYEIAVRSGYMGSETQFGAEQAAVANNSERLTAIETNKADLGTDGYVLSAEIAPLQGKQTGVELVGDSRYTKVLPNEITQQLVSASFSIECYFDWNGSKSDATYTYNMFGITDNNDLRLFSLYRDPNGYTVVRMYNARTDGTAEAVTLPGKMVTGATHMVVTVDRINNTITGYLNGVLFGTNTFTVSTSNSLSTILEIGAPRAVAKPFTARHSRIFNYVLSQGDVNRLYNSGSPEALMLSNAQKPPMFIVPDTNVFYSASNNPATHPSTEVRLEDVNGFSGKFRKIVRTAAGTAAHNHFSVYFNPFISTSIPNFKVGTLMQIEFIYRSNIDFDVSGAFKAEHNLDAPHRIVAYSKSDRILGFINGASDIMDDSPTGWIEYQIVSVRSQTCIAEYLPCGLLADGWRDTSGNGNDLTATGGAALSYEKRYSGSALTPLFVAQGVVYNDKTGYYEYNSILDITEAQMCEIYYRSIVLLGGNWASAFYQSSARTAIFKLHLNSTVDATECFRDSRIETIQLSRLLGVDNISPQITSAHLMFHCATNLKAINGHIKCDSLTSATFMFTVCPLLEYVNLKYLKISISLKDSPLLLRECVLYAITNASNTIPITFTLHADAFARLTEVDIALASSRNITIAVA